MDGPGTTLLARSVGGDSFELTGELSEELGASYKARVECLRPRGAQ